MEWQELDEQLSPQHRVRRLREFVDRLDLAGLYGAYAGVGSEAYRPDLLLKIVVAELLEGRPSPAQWFRDIRDSRALRWISMGIEPSRSALYDFRDRAGKVIQELNAQVVRQAQEQGLVDPDVGVQDGTVFRACASRHRLVNSSTLERRRVELQDALRQDEAGRPVGAAAGWMAATPAGRLQQAQRYQQAQQVLQQRLAHNAKRQKSRRLPDKNVVVSLSDPEAALGRDKEKVFGPCYTAQFVVQPGSRLVVAYHVAAQSTDTGTLPLLLDRTRAVLGRYPQQQVTDAGYVSVLDLMECARRKVELIAPVHENDFTAKKRAEKPQTRLGKESFTWLPEEHTYVCPQGHRLKYLSRHQVIRRDDTALTQTQYRCPPEHCQACPLSQTCCHNPLKGRTIKRLEGEDLLDDHRQRMTQPYAQKLRRLRGSIIERCFADTKAHRKLRCLHGRGLYRAQTEIGLVVLALNLLTLTNLAQTERNSKSNTS